DSAEFCRCERLLGDPGVAVGSNDQVRVGGDFRGDDELRIGLHHNLDAGRPGGRSEAVFAVGNHDAYDADTVLPEHVEGGHAEVAGTDKGDAHGSDIRLATALYPDNTTEGAVTTRRQLAPVINSAGRGSAKSNPRPPHCVQACSGRGKLRVEMAKIDADE